MTDETFQAWRRSAARMTLHPTWPVPIELHVVCLGSLHVVLQCIVHAYNASDAIADQPLVSWEDLPMMDIMFSETVPNIDALDTPACEVARLQHIRARLNEAVLHELDEFLLVDGRVAAPPHETLQPAFAPMPSVKPDEISTWRAEIARISLHPASRLQVDLDVVDDLRGRTTISCVVRHSTPEPPATIYNTASARLNGCHVQQLLALIRHSVKRLLDECLIIDGVPASRISVLPSRRCG